MNDLKRDFKGVWIPKAVWFNKDITPLEKMFLAEIDSLDSDLEKGCFASNEHFAKMFDVSEGRAANIISSLRVRGYIVTIFFDGRNRGIRLSENVKAGFTENVNSCSRKTLTLVHGKRDANNIDTILVTNIEEEKEKAISLGIALPLSSSSPSNEPGSFPVEEKPLYAEKITPAAPAAPRYPHQVYATSSTAPIAPLPSAVTIPDNLNTPEFLAAWEILRQTAKWKKKSPAALQMSLKQLSKFSVKYAVILCETAIAAGWQGVVFHDTDAHYQKWLNGQNTNSNNNFSNGNSYTSGYSKPTRRDTNLEAVRRLIADVD